MNDEQEEILACVKREDIKFIHSGQLSKVVFPMKRKEAHEQEIPHLIVRIFITTRDDQGKVQFLVQKRGKHKKSYPNYYTDSASGHVIFEENLTLKEIKKNAYRELEEEFGISPKEIKSLNYYDLQAETDKFSKELAYIFLGISKSNLTLKPNSDEVSVEESRFYDRNELKAILENENLVDYSKEIWEELLNREENSLFNEIKHSKKDKQNNVALFIGRFQPLHHGHIYVLYRIFESHNMVKIGIGSSQLSHTADNPFTKEERKQFIKSALNKRSISSDKYQIYYIPDIFNAQEWVDHVVSIVGSFSIVYSNSDWVRELFKNENYKIANKLSIFKNKYSGTRIRNMINQGKEDWESLVPNEVINLMKDFNGLKRIRNKPNNGKNNE
ncbi:MAG: nicotinamide-nucleotide adenylyltransferase|nr:nicotinamide-nucleotide adenylyltransferase [Candidatus Lokiarchaeota archaeon]MBD3202054.1 nicotinamide-nucleotide adenylyltransferase [Candidatus Lokiarchaeota archaeon]